MSLFIKAWCVLAPVFVSSVSSLDTCKTESPRIARHLHHQRRFRSRVIESQPINRPIDCHVKCMKNCRCISYNVCNGGKLCELNSEKKKNNISLYERNSDCDYYEFIFKGKVR